MKKHQFWLIMGIVVMVLVGSFYYFTSEKRKAVATWLWDTKQLVNHPEEILYFIEEEDIQLIYLQIDPDVAFETYQSFIAKASNRGTMVYALQGSPEWGMISGNHEDREFIRWFKKYQRASAQVEQFRGMHIDVEPYLLESLGTDLLEIVTRYQQVIRNVTKEAKQWDIVVGMDIPFWFDEVGYDNHFGQGKLAEWIIDEVDEITIMAYRTTAKGKGGIIEIVSQEIEWANQSNKAVFIAVETEPLLENNTTFHNLGLEEMDKQLRIVQSHYQNDPSYHGVAVHHLMNWKAMKESVKRN